MTGLSYRVAPTRPIDLRDLVLGGACLAPLSMPFLSAALVAMETGRKVGEVQLAIDDLEREGLLVRVAGWGYVAAGREEEARALLGRKQE